MDDSRPGDGRVMAARSRHRRFWSFVASGPGIRVVELHMLGTQVQLLSINVGGHRPPVSSCWSPASAAHRQVDRTIIIERRRGCVNHCGRGVLIKQSQLQLQLSDLLECLRRTMWR
jgi:hypothetical protein